MKTTTSATLLTCLILSSTFCACSSLFFHPTEKFYLDPETFGIEYDVISIAKENGCKLNAWHLKTNTVTPPNGYILFLHGNAENISSHFTRTLWLLEEGFDVFLGDYQGYGISSCSPNLSAVHEDVEYFYRTFSKITEQNSKRIIIYGHSLGASLAIVAASSINNSSELSPPALVIAEAGFISYPGIFEQKLSKLLPRAIARFFAKLTVTAKFDVQKHAELLAPVPLLVVHGKHDNIVPVESAREIFRAAKAPKLLLVSEEGTHVDALYEMLTESTEFDRESALAFEGALEMDSNRKMLATNYSRNNYGHYLLELMKELSNKKSPHR